MSRCKKEVEIELSDGTIVEGTLSVEGFFDEEYQLDSGEFGIWLVGSWAVEHDAELDDDQQAEFDEEVEEIVFEEKWDFENATDEDDELDEE